MIEVMRVKPLIWTKCKWWLCVGGIKLKYVMEWGKKRVDGCYPCFRAPHKQKKRGGGRNYKIIKRILEENKKQISVKRVYPNAQGITENWLKRIKYARLKKI